MQDKKPSKTQDHAPAPFGNLIGRTRYFVLIAVAAVLIVAISLFLLGAVNALIGVYNAWARTLSGNFDSTGLTVDFLELVGVMLKAVAFYLVGVGLYSLFIAPLNVAVSLGVESLHDLENKVISVVVVILAVTFLEHFIRWENGTAVLQFGAALAVTVVSLVAFQWSGHRSREEQRAHSPNTQTRSKIEMFADDEEVHDVSSDSAEERDQKS